MPVNARVIRALLQYHTFYGDTLGTGVIAWGMHVFATSTGDELLEARKMPALGEVESVKPAKRAFA